MRHDEPMASPKREQVSAPSCVATPDALADRAGGDGCHLSPPAPISETAGTPDSPRPRFRDPLIDPRAGDLIRLADGSTLEVLDVVLGRGAHVRVREDSSTYRIEHETWRHIAQGATVALAGGES